MLSTRYGRSHQCWAPMGNTSSNLNVHEQIHKSFAYMDQTRAGASGLIIPQPQCIHIRLRGAIGSASDSRSEGCVFKSRRGQDPFLGAGIAPFGQMFKHKKETCLQRGLNSRPLVYKTSALPLSYRGSQFLVLESFHLAMKTL